MMIPNNTGFWSSRGAQNVFAEYTFGTPKRVRCAVVHLNQITAKTSVRTDQSATRGNAEEETAIAKILFRPAYKLEADDKFVIHGFSLRVIACEPRFSVLGHLDHYEVDFGIYEA